MQLIYQAHSFCHTITHISSLLLTRFREEGLLCGQLRVRDGGRTGGRQDAQGRTALRWWVMSALCVCVCVFRCKWCMPCQVPWCDYCHVYLHYPLVLSWPILSCHLLFTPNIVCLSLSLSPPRSHPSWLHQELHVQVPIRCLDVRERIRWREGASCPCLLFYFISSASSLRADLPSSYCHSLFVTLFCFILLLSSLNIFIVHRSPSAHFFFSSAYPPCICLH